MISFLKYNFNNALITIIILISVIVFYNSTINDKKTSAIKENSILVINFSETKIERKSKIHLKILIRLVVIKNQWN